MTTNLFSDFFESLPALRLGEVYSEQSLAMFSRWKIGGTADCVIAPDSIDNLLRLMFLVNKEKVPFVVVGSSSNLLFSDEGIRALVVLIGDKFSEIEILQNIVRAQCGMWVPRFARIVAQAGLSGVEHLTGIPGTLGGLIYMNGGSQRNSIGDHLISVKSISPRGELVTTEKIDCRFSYRSSIFQMKQHIIIEAYFNYPSAIDKNAVRQKMLHILKERRKKFPQKFPNCGSVFISDPEMYASVGPPGLVIEKCGLKGFSKNQAQISVLHANFIINNGGATAADVLYLIHLARSKVKQATGFLMPAEARYVEPDGSIVQAHEKAEELYG